MSLMGREAEVDWEAVANRMEGRSARQCRERWVNYFAPTIRNDPWTEDENRLLVDKINKLGHCWAKIGYFFNGRSENDVKNRWYSHLKFGSTFDPVSGECTLATGETCPMFPGRKKCRRVKALPQQNAMRILEQQKRAFPFFVRPAMERLPPVRPPNPSCPIPHGTSWTRFRHSILRKRDRRLTPSFSQMVDSGLIPKHSFTPVGSQSRTNF
jgi:hypothetical protein